MGKHADTATFDSPNSEALETQRRRRQLREPQHRASGFNSLLMPKRGKDGYLALPCGSLFVNFAEWNDDHRAACATCLGNFGPTPDPDHDQLGCLEWCNHCSVCGTGILYGSLCRAHHNVPLER